MFFSNLIRGILKLNDILKLKAVLVVSVLGKYGEENVYMLCSLPLRESNKITEACLHVSLLHNLIPAHIFLVCIILFRRNFITTEFLTHWAEM